MSNKYQGIVESVQAITRSLSIDVRRAEEDYPLKFSGASAALMLACVGKAGGSDYILLHRVFDYLESLS